jgi:hypothetical protein
VGADVIVSADIELYLARIWVLMTAVAVDTLFWDVTPCNVVHSYRHAVSVCKLKSSSVPWIYAAVQSGEVLVSFWKRM